MNNKRFILIRLILISSLLLNLQTNDILLARGIDKWSEISTANGPPTRSYTEMVYDSESNVVIMVSGQISFPNNSPQDTWTYSANSKTWTNMNPSIMPKGVAGHALAYDSNSDIVIMFGGVRNGDEFSNETWAYDFNSNTWELLYPLISPHARIGHEMVYDVQSERVILFGGVPDLSNSDFFGDVWAYDYATNIWENITPALIPPARIYFSMIYDSSADRTIIFGGYTNFNNFVRSGFKSDTWAFDFESKTWTELNPPNSPAARGYTSLAFNPISNNSLLFGGWNQETATVFNDTWIYDYNTNLWNEIGTNSPGLRSHHTSAFTGDLNQVVVFGGYEFPYGPLVDSTTWIYNFDSLSTISSITSTIITDTISNSSSTNSESEKSNNGSNDLVLEAILPSFILLLLLLRKKNRRKYEFS